MSLLFYERSVRWIHCGSWYKATLLCIYKKLLWISWPLWCLLYMEGIKTKEVFRNNSIFKLIHNTYQIVIMVSFINDRFTIMCTQCACWMYQYQSVLTETKNCPFVLLLGQVNILGSICTDRSDSYLDALRIQHVFWWCFCYQCLTSCSKPFVSRWNSVLVSLNEDISTASSDRNVKYFCYRHWLNISSIKLCLFSHSYKQCVKCNVLNALASFSFLFKCIF